MSAIRPRLIHGFLEACLLSLLEAGPDYGLSLAQRLADAGLDDVPGGTLYPALVRLESRGYVTSSKRDSASGPPRKYFAITTDGRDELATRRAEWRVFTGVLTDIIEQPAVGGVPKNPTTTGRPTSGRGDS